MKYSGLRIQLDKMRDRIGSAIATNHGPDADMQDVLRISWPEEIVSLASQTEDNV